MSMSFLSSIPPTGVKSSNPEVRLSQVAFSLAEINEIDKNNVKRIIKQNIILFLI